jgi:hypothetical protein
MPNGAAGIAQLLSQLQQLTQLEHLDLTNSLNGDVSNPPAADFSALTASSKLQHLSLTHTMLPEGVWQHVFPAGRQLPRLQSLDLSFIEVPPTALLPAEPATPPDSSSLVSCCPSLQSLDLRHLEYGNTTALSAARAAGAAPLAPLQHLSNLRTLLVSNARHGWIDQLEVVAQLTGLRELCLSVKQLTVKNLLLRLTHLKHLTRLHYEGPYDGVQIAMMFPSSGTRVRF